MSVASISPFTMRRSSGSLKSAATLRLLRFSEAKLWLNESPSSSVASGGQPRIMSPLGGSTLTTSAPRSASNMPANGPAATWPISPVPRQARGGVAVLRDRQAEVAPQGVLLVGGPGQPALPQDRLDLVGETGE